MKLVCHYFAIFSRPVLCLFDPSGHCSMPFPINPGRFWSPESELPIYQFNRNLKILDLWHRTQSMMERLAFRKTTKKTWKQHLQNKSHLGSKTATNQHWNKTCNNSKLNSNGIFTDPHIWWQGIFATHDCHPNQDAIFFRNAKGHQDFGHLFLVGKRWGG